MRSLNLSREEDNLLDFDISNWSPPVEGSPFALRLESMIHGGQEGKSRSRVRNMIRLEKATQRQDIMNLSIHYSCCIDRPQRKAIMDLIKRDDREWVSFTMTGINEVGNMYSNVAFSEELQLLLQALKQIRVLKFRSSTINRGHGLELMLKEIPSFSNLEELHLEGWQIDRISASMLMNSLRCHTQKSIRFLSFRSCRFIGENTFPIFCRGLKCVESLSTLDLSHCNLQDTEIILLIGSLKTHPSIKCVDLEKNCCRTQSSVDTIAKWVSEVDCTLTALNIGALWTGFSEEGLLVRFVDPMPLLSAIGQNSSLCDLNVSENYLENEDIQYLTQSLLSQKWSSKLSSLDIGVNPFDENGAASLLQLVRGLKTVQNIEFENPFMTYECTQLVKIQAEANFFDTCIGKSVDISLLLWPKIFARIQKGIKPRKSEQVSKLSADHIYRLLHARTGSYGKQLSLRIALQKKRNHHITLY